MATLDTPTAVAEAFIDGTKLPRYKSELPGHRWEDGEIVRTLDSYGEHFPVLIEGTDKNGEKYFLANEYGLGDPGWSRTTDRHVRGAHRALDNRNYKRAGRVTKKIGRNTFDFGVFVKKG